MHSRRDELNLGGAASVAAGCGDYAHAGLGAAGQNCACLPGGIGHGAGGIDLPH